MKLKWLRRINLRAFDGVLNTNVTTADGMTVEMKTYYDEMLIHAAEPNLVHNQFGQERDIPQGNGKNIEFRKFSRLPKITEPLVEGVTPDGQDIEVTELTASPKQYGGYVTLSEWLQMTAKDPMLQETVKEIGSQAGRSLDTVVREVLNTGTNVQYGEGQVETRDALTADHKLTVKAVKMAVRTLKNANASKRDGDFIGIIHPDIAFDLTEDPEWKYPHQYVDTEEIYRGEIGRIAGVRFVETTEAKCFGAVGADGAAVYATLILGDNAYGITKINGGGMQTIIKQKGSAGTADPLNQRSTVGWKAGLVAKILSDEYMVRIETGCSNSGAAN